MWTVSHTHLFIHIYTYALFLDTHIVLSRGDQTKRHLSFSFSLSRNNLLSFSLFLYLLLYLSIFLSISLSISLFAHTTTSPSLHRTIEYLKEGHWKLEAALLVGGALTPILFGAVLALRPSLGRYWMMIISSSICFLICTNTKLQVIIL